MSLAQIDLASTHRTIPRDVRTFLREAKRRIAQFQHQRRFRGFIPGDFAQIYIMLRTLSEADLTAGRLFCEWGSGFGVVACLAAMLDFDACGVEIEPDLVDAARKLAEDFEIPAEFAEGSFIPKGGERHLEDGNVYSWLATEEGDAYAEFSLALDDFNVIFVYPWPDEEQLTLTLFDRYAGNDALLLTYHGSDEFVLRRKIPRKGR